jgi:ABC-type antimicrobial peptide transport system permease subunit
VRTLDEVLSEAVEQPRFRAALLAVFTVLALAVATVGLYAAVAYSMSHRTREIGIRMALGAREWNVRRMVLREAGMLAICGTLIGLPAAAIAARMLSSALYGISPWDPLSFAVAPTLLMGATLLACYVPARRAVRIDPLTALNID